MPKPSVALWRPKPTIRTSGEADLAGGAGLADREPLGEVVQADAGRDQQREPRPAPTGDATHDCLELGGGAAPGPSERLVALALHPAVVVDEAHQPDGEAARRTGRKTR